MNRNGCRCINVLCYKSKTLLPTAQHPLMIQGLQRRQRRNMLALACLFCRSIGIHDKNKPQRHCPNKDMIEKVIAEKSRQYSERVIELISEHREFTATRLVEQIDSYSPCRMVGDMFLLQIQRLKKQHREGYALSHQEIHHSLLSFIAKIQRPLESISPILIRHG